MGQTDIKWARDLLVLPIVVGIVLVGSQFAIDTYKEKKKNITATIEGPFNIVKIHELFKKADLSYELRYNFETTPTAPTSQQQATKALETNRPSPPSNFSGFASVTFKDLFIYRITIQNTGDLPIRNLPIRFVFNDSIKDFQIVTFEHNTTPEHEFGEIEDDFSENNKPRFIYSLLNPGDEDKVMLLVNENSDLEIFAKAEGISFNTSKAIEDHIKPLKIIPFQIIRFLYIQLLGLC